MTDDWQNRSDQELIEKADQALTGHGALVEAMRRLRNSTDALCKSTDWYSQWLVGLTVILAVLTAVLVYKAFRP
jgi:hypothetical protein